LADCGCQIGQLIERVGPCETPNARLRGNLGGCREEIPLETECGSNSAHVNVADNGLNSCEPLQSL
jgi:hypothetical protein